MLYSAFQGAIGLLFLLVLVTLSEFVGPIERYPLRSRLRGFLFSGLTVFGGVILVGVLQLAWRILGIEPWVIIPVRGWIGDAASVVVAVVTYDFLAYWNHRFQHRFFWFVHVLHHSQTELCAANAYAHFAERGLRFLLFAVPLSLVKCDFAAMPMAVTGFLVLMEAYIHSPTTAHLGPLAILFVDNRFHRIHHSLEERHFDKNFGILLSVWDRLFGTFYKPGSEWPATGVDGVRPPTSVVEYATFPFTWQLPARSSTYAKLPPETDSARVG